MMIQMVQRPFLNRGNISEAEKLYAELLVVETARIEADEKLAAATDLTLINHLASLHYDLLAKHADLLLAASYIVEIEPDILHRLWKRGVNPFLTLLEKALPSSRNYMLEFLSFTFTTIKDLYDKLPLFRQNWMNYLGLLSLYYMDFDTDNLQKWQNEATYWFSNLSDSVPSQGVTYEYLAKASKSDELPQKLLYYSKSLSASKPIPRPRKSFHKIFDLSSREKFLVKPFTAFITRWHPDRVSRAVEEFISHLYEYIESQEYQAWGYYIAVYHATALLFSFRKRTASRLDFNQASRLAHGTLEVLFQNVCSRLILPHLHIILVFMLHSAQFPARVRLLAPVFPWVELSNFLNKSKPEASELGKFEFSQEEVKYLPEDWAMRGMIWADEYYQKSLDVQKIRFDDDIRVLNHQRTYRIRCLGRSLAKSSYSIHLHYDETTGVFSKPERYSK